MNVKIPKDFTGEIEILKGEIDEISIIFSLECIKGKCKMNILYDYGMLEKLIEEKFKRLSK